MASLPCDKVDLSNSTNMPPSILKLHNALKCFSKAHVIIGILILILGAYADVISHRASTVRLHGVIECCAIYFLFTGITGICGAASYRRGLIITFMIMSLHAALIFVPALIVTSSFDIHFYNHECWGECDWHLLAVSVPRDSKCQILCGKNIDDAQRLSMNRLGTDYRLDAFIIGFACVEFFLALATTFVCFQQLFGFCNPAVKTENPGHHTSNIELTPLNLER